MERILTTRIRYEQDVVLARQRARSVAQALGLDRSDQSRMATAVSEIARNAFQYGGGGSVTFGVDRTPAADWMAVDVLDEGPGIADLEEILAGRYRSRTGMGQGILGAHRLLDEVRIETGRTGGTRVSLRHRVPGGVPIPAPRKIATALAAEDPEDPYSEIQRQNQELLAAMEELRLRQEELQRLNAELEETNQGVVALYAELDEKAVRLAAMNEAKARFLSHMSHELRTPLNAIISLSRILADPGNGRLEEEQLLQVGYLQKAAQDVVAMVNDLLDIAKIEAGKVVPTFRDVSVDEVFSGLRGAMRALVTSPRVSLVVEPPDAVRLRTDEVMFGQILRNLVSNALKFTEEGEVRVRALLGPDGTTLEILVSDTGIGIAPEDQERIFEEYEQVRGPLQGVHKGTGLGLPLSRRLAELLGGTLTLESEPGRGSTFRLVLPLGGADGSRAEGPAERPPALADPVSAEDRGAVPGPDPALVSPLPALATGVALVVDDIAAHRHVLRKLLEALGATVVEASGGREAARLLEAVEPAVLLLDLQMPDMDGRSLLDVVRRREGARRLPVVVVTSADLSPPEVGWFTEQGVPLLRKSELDAAALRGAVAQAVAPASALRPSGQEAAS